MTYWNHQTWLMIMSNCLSVQWSLSSINKRQLDSITSWLLTVLQLAWTDRMGRIRKESAWSFFLFVATQAMIWPHTSICTLFREALYYVVFLFKYGLELVYQIKQDTSKVQVLQISRVKSLFHMQPNTNDTSYINETVQTCLTSSERFLLCIKLFEYFIDKHQTHNIVTSWRGFQCAVRSILPY